MIRFTLRCAEGHGFESWFASGDAFARLKDAGQVVCPDCGSQKVEKALMTPRVRPSRKASMMQQDAVPGGEDAGPVSVAATPVPDPEIAEAIRKLKKHVETNSEDMGDRFASEARAMHLGDVDARPIHGQATGEEARELIEDGVPVLPLPFIPTRKTN
jgi:hypothetical protein